jgi:hypothetical protein
MGRKKRNSKQFSSKQIFITLLIVLIIAFGAIFLFSGTDANVAGQAVGTSQFDVPVYIFDDSGNYLCKGGLPDGWAGYAITTCKNPTDDEWIIEKETGEPYYMKHVASGDYLRAEHKSKGTDNLYLNTLTAIKSAKTGRWYLQKKGVSANDEENKYLITRGKNGYYAKSSTGNVHLIGKTADATLWNIVPVISTIVEGKVCFKEGDVKNDAKNIPFTCLEKKWMSLENFDLPFEVIPKDFTVSCKIEGVSKDKKDLCYNEKTISCDGWHPPENYDGKYFCPGSSQPEWLVCDSSAKGLININKERYCDGKIWNKCGATQEKEDFGDSLFCKSGQWFACNKDTKDTLSNKLLCDGSKWTECNTLNVDLTSSNGIYTCALDKDGISKWDVTSGLSYDLESGYELTFTKNKPLSVDDLNIEFTFCSGPTGDNPAVTTDLKVCRENNKLFDTLQKNILLPTKILTKDVALLYQYTDSTKIGSLFLRMDLSPQEQKFDSNKFTNAMITGKRIALGFEDRIYLLEHGKSNTLSLQNMKLKIYGESSEEIYEAKGNENKVEFILPEGKIIVQRVIENKEAFFVASALTKAEIVNLDIDLNKELSVKMSSEYAVKINDNPKLGVIKANEDDLNLDADSFKVEYAGVPKLALAKGVPEVVKKGDQTALLYYDEINIQGDKAIKSLQVFQHFDITTAKKSRVYNNEFIKTFTGGNEFVLQYGKSFYRVSYADPPKTSVTLFSLEKLQLLSLDGKNKYVPKNVDLASKQVTFLVSEGGIVFEKKDEQNLLEFHTQSAVELTTEEFNAEDYSTFFTKDTPVKVNGITYQLKDSGFTSTLDTQARIIKGNSVDTFKVLKKDQVDVVDGHLFWFKGLNAKGLKEISVQPIVAITNNKVKIDDWGDILAKAKDAKSKAIWWQNEYFDLVGDKKLASYSLRTIPEGKTYLLLNSQVAEDETENGTFAFNEHLLFAKQVLDLKTTEASLELTPVNHKLLTSAGLNSTAHGKTLSFVTSVGGSLYTMTHSTVNNNLFIIGSLFSPSKSFLKMSLPEGKSTQILFPDLTTGMVEVLNTTTSEIKITK